MAKPQSVLTLKFPQGANNVAFETGLPGESSPDGKVRSGAARDILNLDVRKDGGVSVRPGYSKVIDLTGAHSLFSTYPFAQAYAVANGALWAILPGPGWSKVQVAALTSNAEMSYTVLEGEVYYSNGTDMGIVPIDYPGRREWGVEQPAIAPTVVPFATLPEGEYQFAVTYVAMNGEESAPSPIGVTNGSFRFSAIPQPSGGGVDWIRLYRTTPSGGSPNADDKGTLLYRCGEVPVGVTTAIPAYTLDGPILRRPFAVRTPPSALVRSWRGRIFFVQGSEVCYSEALEPGLHDPRVSRLPFNSQITLLAPTDGGLFVADQDRTYFLGEDPAVFLTKTVRSPRGAVPGSHQDIPATAFTEATDPSATVPVWMNTDGVWCRGAASGQIGYLTEGRFAAQPRERATALFRDAEGVKNLITILSGQPQPLRQNPLPAQTKDSPVSSVHRYGLRLP